MEEQLRNGKRFEKMLENLQKLLVLFENKKVLNKTKKIKEVQFKSIYDKNLSKKITRNQSSKFCEIK